MATSPQNDWPGAEAIAEIFRFARRLRGEGGELQSLEKAQATIAAYWDGHIKCSKFHLSRLDRHATWSDSLLFGWPYTYNPVTRQPFGDRDLNAIAAGLARVSSLNDVPVDGPDAIARFAINRRATISTLATYFTIRNLPAERFEAIALGRLKPNHEELHLLRGIVLHPDGTRYDEGQWARLWQSETFTATPFSAAFDFSLLTPA